MVKVCASFKQFVCLGIFERDLYFRCCFYLDFILKSFGSLAKQLFFIKIYFLFYETLQIFCFYKHASFSTIIFNIKEFDISMGYDLNILSNNANGFTSLKKRIKMFEYFWEKIANKGILFLQETHSSHDTVINWLDDFKGELFFSNGTTNSCSIMIGYLGSNKVKVNRIKKDNQHRILIVEADIDEETFFLINLYNANTETEQIKTIYELDQLLTKKIILAGDLNLFFDPILEASGCKPAF